VAVEVAAVLALVKQVDLVGLVVVGAMEQAQVAQVTHRQPLRNKAITAAQVAHKAALMVLEVVVALQQLAGTEMRPLAVLVVMERHQTFLVYL